MVIMQHDLEVHMASSLALWVACLVVVGQKWKWELGEYSLLASHRKEHPCVV